MEHLVLKVLGFDLSVPTIHIFVSKMVELGGVGENTKNKIRALALYLAELSMVDGDFLKYPPSQVNQVGINQFVDGSRDGIMRNLGKIVPLDSVHKP